MAIKPHVPVHDVEAYLSMSGVASTVKVDGIDLAKRTVAFDTHAEVGEITTVKLTMVAGVKFKAAAIVELDEDTEALLRALRWTPPGECEYGCC
jgi:hypothetical protein